LGADTPPLAGAFISLAGCQAERRRDGSPLEEIGEIQKMNEINDLLFCDTTPCMS